MLKGKKRWLIALLAALAGAIPVLVPQAGPVVDMLKPLVVEPEPLEPLELDPRQCGSNWSVCPQVPSVDLHSPPR